MERTYALEEIQAIVYPILRSHGVSRAYLFGSYARGEATGKSDIDLRIDAGKIKGMFALGALYHDLTEVLEKSVHLVTTESLEHSANVARTKRFRSNIEEDERLIYEETEQPVACSRFYRK
nr:nucleotidyltransferase domain-containing protein [uncultured Acetatifactor sp.]